LRLTDAQKDVVRKAQDEYWRRGGGCSRKKDKRRKKIRSAAATGSAQRHDRDKDKDREKRVPPWETDRQFREQVVSVRWWRS
jgi:hypothetical protein